MTPQPRLAWRVPVDDWNAFTGYIRTEWDATHEILRPALSDAMHEFLDLLAVLDELDQDTDGSALSSSIAVAELTSDSSGETHKVGTRISADLQERFKDRADRHDAGYGALLGGAARTYADRGLARVILNGTKRALGTSSVEAPLDAVESLASDGHSSLSTVGGAASTEPIVRSTWESRINTLLNDSSLSYHYEPRAFTFDDGRKYIPDFVVEDTVAIEVKGQLWGGWGVKRARLFMEQFSQFEYVVVGNSDVPCDVHVPWDDRTQLISELWSICREGRGEVVADEGGGHSA